MMDEPAEQTEIPFYDAVSTKRSEGADMTSKSQLFPSNVPSRHYRELDFVAQGGESLVYTAVQVDGGVEGRIVAVKECSTKTTKEKGWTIYDRFKRQADFMHQLKHPNIVDFHEFVEGNGRFLELYLIMEFLEGQNLRQRLHTNASGTGRALPLDELIRVNEQVIGALKHAHGKNIVHRDLKPEQIMLLPDGTVKLLDFGAGKAISGGDTATLLTSAGATYQYAAPEQLGFHKENYSPATDAYAFGVMLYEMLTGRQLPRSDENFRHTIPNGVNLGRFEDVIRRGIAWEPDKRATLDNFRRILEDRPPSRIELVTAHSPRRPEQPRINTQPYILRNVRCVGSDGNVFEEYAELHVQADVVRLEDTDHRRFTPYQASVHFERQGEQFVPSMALSCNVLVALFRAAVRKNEDGTYTTLDEHAKQLLDQYKNYGQGRNPHAQNTVVNWKKPGLLRRKKSEIIHYPTKDDFRKYGGPTGINTQRQKITKQFDREGFEHCTLEDACQKTNMFAYLQDLTGLQNPAELGEVAEYYGRTPHVWISRENKTRAAWLGYNDFSSNFDLSANGHLYSALAPCGVVSVSTP